MRLIKKSPESRVRIIPQVEKDQPPKETSRVRLTGEVQNEGNDQDAIRNRNHRMQAETALLHQRYEGLTLSSPIRLETHHPQKYLDARDGSGIDSCVVASLINALQAIHADSAPTDEDTIIDAMGGREQFLGGRLHLGQAQTYLSRLGIESESVHSVLDDNLTPLFADLEKGGVGILSYGGHARLISGFDVKEGHISLRVNDPLLTEVQVVPLDDLVRAIEATGTYQNLLLIHPPVRSGRY